jgi:peptidylprolyl isomerase
VYFLAIKKGSFVLIDYVGRVKQTGDLFDTTLEEVAKAEKVYRENMLYEPTLVVVGEGWVVEGLDEELVNLELEKPMTIEIPPEKAFGPRDPSKIRSIPLRRLRSEKVNPIPGMQIEINGRPAVIRSVGAGRVQVDFNPALAGKVLEYNVTLRKIISRKKEKIEALLHRRFPSIEQTKFKVKTTKRRITLTIPEEAFLIAGLQYAKQGFFTDLKNFFTGFKELVFEEVYQVEEKRTTKPKDDEKSAEQPDGGE